MMRARRMNGRPLLSIIIPTRNRAKYAASCIRSLLSISDSKLEVVVQDNSDRDPLLSSVAEMRSDGRLLYNQTSEKLDVAENFSRGLELASGEYVGFLGDDDGVNPELMSAVRWAKAQKLEAITGNGVALYAWPDVRYKTYGAFLSGAIRIRPFTAQLSYPDPEEELARCARCAASSFGRLPKVYHGAVRREVFDRVRDKAGTYFPGPTPDMSSAVALCAVVKRMCYVDYPLFIVGTGRESGSGAGAEKKHEWSFENVPWFPRWAITNWSDMVPRFCCGATLWAEDLVQALNAMGRQDMLPYFNVALLHARCAVFGPRRIGDVISSLQGIAAARHASSFQIAIRFVGHYLRTWASRAGFMASNIALLTSISRGKLISNLPDIQYASWALTSFLNRRERSLNVMIPW